MPPLQKKNHEAPSGTSTFCTDKKKCTYSPTLPLLSIGNGDTIINITGYDINQYLLSTTNEYVDKRLDLHFYNFSFLISFKQKIACIVLIYLNLSKIL